MQSNSNPEVVTKKEVTNQLEETQIPQIIDEDKTSDEEEEEKNETPRKIPPAAIAIPQVPAHFIPYSISAMAVASGAMAPDSEHFQAYKRYIEQYQQQQLANASGSSTPSTPAPSASTTPQAPVKDLKAKKKAANGKGAKSGAASSRNDSKNCRDDSSLRLLTKKFVSLIGEAPEGTVDLNAAADTLSVQKRRIYDITNVLEGVGLIEKKSKNHIQWKGSGIAVSSQSAETTEEMQLLSKELAQLAAEEAQVDHQIATVRHTLKHTTENPEYQKKAYVTYNDIRNIGSLRNRTIIAIRAPSGTTLQVPDPDDGMENGKRRFQIFLHSPSLPIKVFLLSNDEPTTTAAATTSAAPAIPQDLDEEPRTPPRGSSKQAESVPLSPANFDIQQLSPVPADPDFIYGMEENEGITDFFV